MNSPSTRRYRAIIAEDEVLLAQALQADLAHIWPELDIVAVVNNGDDALAHALSECPDVLFLDIRMPGPSGLEVAQAIAEDWPNRQAPPLLVFVTAYDVHAIEAFDLAAIDYLLKPVRVERLAATVTRLQGQLATRLPQEESLAALAAQLRPLLAQPDPHPEPLRVLRAGVGNNVRLIPLDEVIYLQAADKYISVVCANSESLLRTSLNALAPRLDSRFMRIHRGTIVNLDYAETVERDEAGKTRLTVRGRPEPLPVSRLYAHHFRAM